jgi:hypothetical protein
VCYIDAMSVFARAKAPHIPPRQALSKKFLFCGI